MKRAAANTAARRLGPKRSPSTPLPAPRSAGASCTLRDTFFGHPASVCTGPSEILAYRAQVRDGLRPTTRPMKRAAANTAARRLGPKRSPSTPPPAPRSAGASCTLRDTFFGHPASVCTGPSKILAHRAQVRDGLRPTPGPMKRAAANTAARRLGLNRKLAALCAT